MTQTLNKYPREGSGKIVMDNELIDQLGTFLDALQDETTSEQLYGLSNKIQKWIEAGDRQNDIPSMTHERYKSTLKSIQCWVIDLADERASEDAANRAKYERERYWEIRIEKGDQP